MMAFDQRGLDEYVDVAQRIADFRERHPEGSLQPLNPAQPFDVREVKGTQKNGQEFSTTFIVYTAAAYRDRDDPRPGIGIAWEVFPGRTPYTLGSELMNAETSAWGRAIIAALASDSKRGVASREEVRNRQAERDEPPNGQPAQRHQNGNGNGNGTVSRPAQRPQQPAQPPEGSADGAVDEDAQVYADDAHEARSLQALKDVHGKAYDASKLQAVIRNPTSGKTGPLGVYLEWRRKQLTDEAKALKELRAAAGGMPETDLEVFLQSRHGCGLEDATATQMRQATKELLEGEPAA